MEHKVLDAMESAPNAMDTTVNVVKIMAATPQNNHRRRLKDATIRSNLIMATSHLE
jgi:hypothetical protein